MIWPVLAPFSLGMGLLKALWSVHGSVHEVSAMCCWTGSASPAACVTTCRSAAGQAAVAYRNRAPAAHENGRSAIVPARPQRGRHGRALSTVTREADTPYPDCTARR